MNFFTKEKNGGLYKFIPVEKIHSKFNETYSVFVQCLKDGDHQFSLLEDYLNNNDDPRNKDFVGIINLLKPFLSTKSPIWFHYLLNIDLLRALKLYYTLEEDDEVEVNPDSIDILSQNFLAVRDNFLALEDFDSFKEKVEKQFNILLEAPIKYSFKNLKGMVKDVGKTLGKKVKLQLTGDQGSLGKENISLLKDAVIHIVRNALDHGIESPRERESVGKNEVGEITVSCKEIQFEEGPSNFKKEHGDLAPDLVGVTELTSPYFFVPPSGTTAERPESCAAGTLRFNTDIGTLEIYRGDTIGWVQIQRNEIQIRRHRPCPFVCGRLHSKYSRKAFKESCCKAYKGQAGRNSKNNGLARIFRLGGDTCLSG